MPDASLPRIQPPPKRRPPFRNLRVYAFDPSLNWQIDTAVINQMTLQVPWEDLTPGPVGEYLEVVDVDPASACCYAPVDLEDRFLLAQSGLDPAEGDPDGGIPPGTSFDDIPGDWFCPVCGARKADFSPYQD